MNTEIKVSIPISFELLKQIDDLAKEEKENAVEPIERVVKNFPEHV